MSKKASLLLVAMFVAVSVFAIAFTAFAADRGPWASGVSYAVNDTVTYNGVVYKCIQAHTSQPDWNPPAVPALWTPLGTPTQGGGATATPTNTSVPPTNTPTRTNTPVGPTNTPTNTSVGPTNTPTNTSIAPSNTPTRTNTPTATNTSSGAGCWTAWVSTTAYNGGAQVSYNGQNYQAAFWTQGDTPDTHSGPPGSGQPWIPMGACGGGGSTNTPTRTNTPVGPTNTPTRTPTTGPSATPCGNCGGGLPKHVITGYWHNFNNGSTVMKLSAVPSAYNLIAVAFADATGSPGAVTFNLDPATGYANTTEFINDISAIHGQGRKVIISVGGQNGTISVSDGTSATNFANSIVSLMNTYGFDGVDIDLENGINATFMEQALRSIKSQKPNLIITMAPQTIDMQPGQVNGSGYFKLALNIRDILTIVNMQYYNSGSMIGCDGNVYSQGTINFLTALACIQLQAGLSPAQVGLGLPATTAAAGGGFVSPSVVNNALDCLAARTNCGSFVPAQAWPGIRGAMTWSINWDATSSYNWVNTINAHLPSVP